MNNVLLTIESVGSGTDEAYGMDSGYLQWSSASGLKTGIIDEKSITGIAQAIDITKGGNLGGFIGDVSIVAVSSELITAVVAGTITLIGKVVKVGVAFDGTTTPIPRFIGRVSSWTAIDEITLEIVCRNETTLDSNVIPSVTITQEMALNVSGSNAIGKSVTTTYGNICDFPLVQVDAESAFSSLCIDGRIYDGSDLILDAYAPPLSGSIQQKDNAGNYKGESSMMLLGAWQETADKTAIWVAVSFNGTKFFEVASETEVDKIKSALVGSFVTITNGKGKGESYPILGAEWATHDMGDVNLETIWLQINLYDIDAIKHASGYSLVWDNNISAKPFHPKIFGDLVIDSWFIAPYDSKDVVNDVSYIKLSFAQNVFIVSKSANLDNATLYGSFDNGSNKSSMVIPVNAINVLYEATDWKMIKINISDVIGSEKTSFSVSDPVDVETRFRTLEYDLGGGDTFYSNGCYLLDARRETFSDGRTDYQNITTELTSTYSRTIPDASVNLSIRMDSVFLIPVNGLVDGLNLFADGVESSAVPTIDNKYSFNKATTAFSGELLISVSIIGQGNVVIGQKSFESGLFYFDAFTTNDISIKIDQENQAVVFSANRTDGDIIDVGMFSKIKSALSMSDIIDTATPSDINYIYITATTLIANSYLYPTQTGVVFTGTKKVNKAKINTTRSISKDNLYLRTLRDGNLANTSCPAGLSASIALENGIDIYPDSFGEVLITQRTLFDQSSADFDGQFQPDNDTSVSDCLSEIAKSSMMAMYQKQDGLLYCKWFADDDQDTTSVITFDGSNIVKGSMQISKPQGGYLYTDFVYDISRGIASPKETLYINTDADNSTFPSSGVYDVSGTLYNSANGWTLTTTTYSQSDKILGVSATKSASSVNPFLLFSVGTIWQIYSGGVAYNAIINAIAPDMLLSAGTRGVRLGFTLIDSSVPASFTPTSMQLRNPNEVWRDYVSGSFVTDHTTAKNIWDHAESARIKLGLESVMPSDTTTLKNPIWGSDSRALMQWVLYTTIYATRDKTIIRFTAPMTAETSALSIMDYAEFAWGIYASTPTKGWIIETSDNLANQTIDFTILTSVSDSDILILNENYASADFIYDERTTADENYNEGLLA